ncbi:single-stranded-DNA-specific exonuclease RecJ-like [Tenebrio molitor]|uniref:single-stranded-DNA-specific exonuclease RecJ-like n=1 Tax=Tenebrio molitor TaxID=7067 RepID=UPI00362491C3
MTQSLFHLIRERRGWDNDYIREVNKSDHPDLMDVDLLVEKLHEVRVSGQKLVVVPDFDVDGITSGVIGLAGFAELGFNVGLYLPDYHRGHDFGAADVKDVLTQHPDADALITCDVGISAHEGVDAAREKGLSVFVTDHHLETNGRVNADVVIDPSREDETYPNKGICGAHVIYQVVRAYAREHQPEKLDDIDLLRLFAGIGTVADVMPLVYENRQLVKDSISLARLLYVAPIGDTRDKTAELEVDPSRSTLLALLRSTAHHPLFVSAFEGMGEILAAFTRRRKLRDVTGIDAGFYGFYLAPAMNSIRRIDGEISDAFGTFFGKTKEICFERVLDGNDKRKELVIQYMEDIASEDQPFAPYVYLTDAPAGVLGLLANKLMDKQGCPAVVLHRPDGPGQVSGSARAPMWYPLNSTVNGYEGFSAIGHEQACGVRVSSFEKIGELAEIIEKTSTELFAQLSLSGELDRLESFDLEIGSQEGADCDIDQIEELIETVGRLQSLEPFGHGFEAPSVRLTVDLADVQMRTIGAEKQHLAIVLSTGVKCLWWNRADIMLDLQERGQDPAPGASIAQLQGELSVNLFMGNVSLDFIVSSIKLAEQ